MIMKINIAITLFTLYKSDILFILNSWSFLSKYVGMISDFEKQHQIRNFTYLHNIKIIKTYDLYRS